MSSFNAFAPFGMFKFSNSTTRGERIYRALKASKEEAFDMTEGGYEEAKTYAQAMGIARGRYALERALNQLDPLKAIELLNKLEVDWAMIPGEFETILDRQLNLAARMILSRGATRTSIEAALRLILTTHFVTLRSCQPIEAVANTSSEINPVRYDLPFKVIRLTSPVTALNEVVEVSYENLDLTAGPWRILANDTLIVEPENTGLSELITVLSATDTTFTAVFNNAHDLNCVATTQNWVNWISTQRHLFVVTDATAVIDAELCRRTNDFMSVICRGVTTWDIICDSTLSDFFEFTGWWRA